MFGWLLLLALALFYGYFRYSIRHLLVVDKMFPGPMGLPIVGNALMGLRSNTDLAKMMEELAIFYRRSFRGWAGNRVFILLWHSKDVETLMTNSEEITKSSVYEFLFPWIGDGLLTSTGDKWKKHRKILTPAFHFQILEKFVNVFNVNSDILCRKLSDIRKDEVFDAFPYLKMCALDNICEAAMGTSIHAQEKPNSEYVRSIKIMCDLAFRRGITPWLRPDFLFNLTKYAAHQRRALEVIHRMTNEVIRQRKLELQTEKKAPKTDEDGFKTKERMTFLDILLTAAEEKGLTDKDIRDEVNTFMFEGHDTITSGLSFTFHMLAKYQEFQEKSYQEQVSIFGDDDRQPTWADLQEMKYLEMVIKETLRQRPSVALIGRTAQKDIVIDQHCYIPRGADVFVGIPYLHHNVIDWGYDYRTFNPENFSPEAVQKRHPFAYIPFSAGPRNCIGQKFAMLEMKATISKVLRSFKLLPSPFPEDEPQIFSDLIVNSANGFQVRIEQRKIQSEI